MSVARVKIATDPTILFVLDINAAIRTSKQISRSAFPRSKASQKGGLVKNRKTMIFSLVFEVFKNLRLRFRMSRLIMTINHGARKAGIRKRSMI